MFALNNIVNNTRFKKMLHKFCWLEDVVNTNNLKKKRRELQIAFILKNRGNAAQILLVGL